MDIDKVSSQQLITLSGGRADTEFGGPNNYFTIGYLPELSEYAEVVKSQSDTATFECSISEKTMDHYGLVAGEKVYLHVPDGSGKKEISFVISQICREKDINDPYWAKTLSDMGDVIFVSQDVFDEMMQYYSEDNISYSDFLMLDYRQINTENASLYDGYMEQFKDADKLYNDNIRDTLDGFFTQQKTIKLMLWALELPCLVLLILFIRMISAQILSLEENDILVLRSRGATKLQVFFLFGWYCFGCFRILSDIKSVSMTGPICRKRLRRLARWLPIILFVCYAVFNGGWILLWYGQSGCGQWRLLGA